MRSGTGAKVRKLRASGILQSELFAFNRSIHPHGGLLSRMKIRGNKKGETVLRLYQDINYDGKVSGKELIFAGKSRNNTAQDHLINFSGSVRLKKTMHLCDWLIMKDPDTPIMCTMEYIPVVYDMKLVTLNGIQQSLKALANSKTNVVADYSRGCRKIISSIPSQQTTMPRPITFN